MAAFVGFIPRRRQAHVCCANGCDHRRAENHIREFLVQCGSSQRSAPCLRVDQLSDETLLTDGSTERSVRRLTESECDNARSKTAGISCGKIKHSEFRGHASEK